MVAQHFRWDFVGLSTDTKPTPETSEKVVDGSTFYCSDTSKLYVFCKDDWYERKPLGGGGGTTYTAGDGIDITDNTISVDTDNIQAKLTAGSNITISDDTISATDTTYSNFVGTNGTSAGTAGLVPAPATTDAGKFLKADGTWDTAGGGGATVVQTTGTSTTDVMSQNATTSMVYADPSTQYSVHIGERLSGTPGTDSHGVSIGYHAVSATESITIGENARAGSDNATVVGRNATATGRGSVAIGEASVANGKGVMGIGFSGPSSSYGYNNSEYRLLTGLYEPQSAHDAATKGYVDARIILNAGAPSTATVGTVGQLLEDTTNGKLYQCTAVSGNTYTWSEVGAGGGGGGATIPKFYLGGSISIYDGNNTVNTSLYKDSSLTTAATVLEVYNALVDNTGIIVIKDQGSNFLDYVFQITVAILPTDMQEWEDESVELEIWAGSRAMASRNGMVVPLIKITAASPNGSTFAVSTFEEAHA